MKLARLSLRHFKGTRSLDLEPNGEDLTIYGDNATGKTTIVDAFTWLLFGKDSRNRTDFEVKTLNDKGEPESDIDHSVAAVLDLGDRTLTLKRTYREKKTRKRGAAKKEFTGHETLYEVDGVPEKKGEFDKVVAAFADEKNFRLLTDPLYFNTVLHWKDRRTTLIDACGGVEDADVIATDKALKELPDILKNRTPDDYRKIAQGKKQEVNRELEDLPVRIDEVRNGMPTPQGSKADAEAGLKKWREIRREQEEALANARSGGADVEIRRRVAEVEAQMAEAANALRSAADVKIREAQDAANAAEVRRSKITVKLMALNDERDGTHQRIAAANAERERLRARHAEVRAEEPPKADVVDTCPACGRALPPSKVQEARDKALANFNQDKAERLERIRAEGHTAKERADAAEHKLADLLAAIEEAEKEQAAAQAAYDKAAKALESARAAAPDPTKDEAYTALVAERDALNERRKAAEGNGVAEIVAIQAKIDEVDEMIAERTAALAVFDRVAEADERVATLKAREKELTTAFEEVERHLFLLDEFDKAKAALLTERINSHFERARFKLFEEQINGGIEPTCVTTYQGVPFDSLNHGSRLNVGLDIINTLTDHYGFAPPVFIDNAESVTSLLPTRGQQIRLVVSAADKALRIEETTELVK